MATRKRSTIPLETTEPRTRLRPAGEQALDAASWARLRKVIEALAALPAAPATPPRSSRAPTRRR